MKIKKFKIKNREDIVKFFTYLLKDLRLGFEPETSFSEYINLADETPVFSPEQAAQLDGMLKECSDWCQANSVGIDNLALEAFNIYKNVDFDLDKFVSEGCNSNPYLQVGAWQLAAAKAGWSALDITMVINDALSSDYEHLKAVIQKNSNQASK